MSVSREVATITRCCPTPTAFSLLRVLSWFLTDRSSSKPVTSSGIDGSGSLALFGVSIEHPRWPSRSVPPRGPRSAPRFARESGFRSLPRSLPRGLAPEDPRSSRRGRPPPELVRRSSPPPGPRRSPPRSGRPDDEPRRGSSSRGRRAGWSSDTGLAPFVVVAWLWLLSPVVLGPAQLTANAKEPRPVVPGGGSFTMYVRRRPTLPHRHQCSTIGAEGLSFRVRNGAGRFPFAMTAVTLGR